MTPFVVMASVLFATAVCPAQDQSRIDEAVEKGRNYLLEDGLRGAGGGRAALTVATLIKSGTSPDEPAVAEALEKIAARCQSGDYTTSRLRVYDAAVFIMALAEADPEKYRDAIQSAVDFLAADQRLAGGWFYTDSPSPEAGDTSQTQIALLGMWAAVRAGAHVDPTVWDRAASWHITRQNKSGAYGYHPIKGGAAGEKHSTTVGGLGSLEIVRLHLFPGARDTRPAAVTEVSGNANKKPGKKFGVLESVTDLDPAKAGSRKPVRRSNRKYVPKTRLASIDAAIAKGTGWLERKFTIDKPVGHPIYYLYSLERFATLAGLQVIGDHDWFQEGATHLLKTQGSNGSWRDESGVTTGTCFALLFLTRATEKMIGGRRPTRLGGGLLAGGRGLPENLSEIRLEKGTVKARKLTGPVDALLAELENPASGKVENAQAALVEQVLTENPKALIGKTGRLLKLSGSRNIEVRRTAMWALGRSYNLRAVPKLIEGLTDSQAEVVIEARNALRHLSKKIDGFGLPEQPTAAQRANAVGKWKKWYLTVRPYDDRDDLLTSRR